MKKILFATNNLSKLDLYRKILAKEPIEIIGLDDINIEYEVEEIGNNEQEIAIKKVTEYGKISKMTVMSEDTGLYFDNVNANEQPGTKINSINGRKMSEDERIEHYVNFVKKHGGKLIGTYRKALAIHDTKLHTSVYERKVIFVDKICANRNPGFPLDSITITPEYNKYTAELTEQENINLNNKSHKHAYEFITKILGLKG